MNTSPPLSGSHRHTYDAIFQHPLSHNLNWRAVLALLKHLGEVVEEPNGSIKVTRNGQVLVIHRPGSKDVADADEVMTLRHFLEKSGTTQPDTDSKDTHWLLVIDHHEARVFRADLQGGHPLRILPDGHFRHTRDSANVSKGKEKPDEDGYFKPVAKALGAGGPVLVFGTGTGTSSEMVQFIAWVKIHHPELAGRIIGSLTVDEHHLTPEQLLAKAQDFYAEAGTPKERA